VTSVTRPGLAKQNNAKTNKTRDVYGYWSHLNSILIKKVKSSNDKKIRQQS